VIIGSEIHRLERIVRDFLQFARPSEPEFYETTADALLKNVFELFRSQFQNSGIDFKMDAPANLKFKIDPQQIEQVLINLMRNAAESLDEKGSVFLKAYTARLPARGNAVALEVTDTGRGIPTEVKKRLFDPFYTTKANGTGLGLSIAARIVEIHGGSIQYRSENGRRTTFVVLLPAAE
jgi:signal transduction histidine kinase